MDQRLTARSLSDMIQFIEQAGIPFLVALKKSPQGQCAGIVGGFVKRLDAAPDPILQQAFLSRLEELGFDAIKQAFAVPDPINSLLHMTEALLCNALFLATINEYESNFAHADAHVRPKLEAVLSSLCPVRFEIFQNSKRLLYMVLLENMLGDEPSPSIHHARLRLGSLLNDATAYPHPSPLSQYSSPTQQQPAQQQFTSSTQQQPTQQQQQQQQQQRQQFSSSSQQYSLSQKQHPSAPQNLQQNIQQYSSPPQQHVHLTKQTSPHHALHTPSQLTSQHNFDHTSNNNNNINNNNTHNANNAASNISADPSHSQEDLGSRVYRSTREGTSEHEDNGLSVLSNASIRFGKQDSNNLLFRSMPTDSGLNKPSSGDLGSFRDRLGLSSSSRHSDFLLSNSLPEIRKSISSLDSLRFDYRSPLSLDSPHSANSSLQNTPRPPLSARGVRSETNPTGNKNNARGANASTALTGSPLSMPLGAGADLRNFSHKHASSSYLDPAPSSLSAPWMRARALPDLAISKADPHSHPSLHHLASADSDQHGLGAYHLTPNSGGSLQQTSLSAATTMMTLSEAVPTAFKRASASSADSSHSSNLTSGMSTRSDSQYTVRSGVDPQYNLRPGTNTSADSQYSLRSGSTTSADSQYSLRASTSTELQPPNMRSGANTEALNELKHPIVAGPTTAAKHKGGKGKAAAKSAQIHSNEENYNSMLDLSVDEMMFNNEMAGKIIERRTELAVADTDRYWRLPIAGMQSIARIALVSDDRSKVLDRCPQDDRTARHTKFFTWSPCTTTIGPTFKIKRGCSCPSIKRGVNRLEVIYFDKEGELRIDSFPVVWSHHRGQNGDNRAKLQQKEKSTSADSPTVPHDQSISSKDDSALMKKTKMELED